MPLNRSRYLCRPTTFDDKSKQWCRVCEKPSIQWTVVCSWVRREALGQAQTRRLQDSTGKNVGCSPSNENSTQFLGISRQIPKVWV